MPDPIRCTVDPSQAGHTVTCEPVEIGPDSKSSEATTPAPASASQQPAVAALVKRFPTGQHEVHAPPVATVTTGSAEQCLGEIAALALVFGVEGRFLPAAAAFKVGYDLGACLAKEEQGRQLSADRQRGFAECEINGGTVVGEVGHTLICEPALPEVSP